jgi:hypothetical protein
MSKIQLRVVGSNPSQVVLDDIQYLKKNLNEILVNSHQSLVENLIKVNELWFDAHKHYRDTPSAIEFIKCIDHITNYSIAYSNLLLSLSLINGERVSENGSNLEQIIPGFLFLSQTTDVFTDFFSDSELQQIYAGAKNIISLWSRNVNEYFATDLESSKLVTQLRGYSSLIILSIDEHYKNKDDSIETIREGIYQGWQEARTGRIHPISELWEGIDVD